MSAIAFKVDCKIPFFISNSTKHPFTKIDFVKKNKKTGSHKTKELVVCLMISK